MSPLRDIIDILLRLFALGLFVSILLGWILNDPATGFRKHLDAFYEPFLKRIRRYVKPFKISPSAPAQIDPSPFILLLLIYCVIHPFLMWVLGGE